MREEEIKRLTEFLKAKAKELRSDWDDVPQWVIEASIDWMQSKKEVK